MADLNNTFEENTNRIREQVNALELLVQPLRKLPLSDQDQQHVDRLDYSTRDIRISLDYSRDQMAGLNNALEFSKDMLFGDDTKEMMDWQNKSPEAQANASTAFHKKMQNLYSAMFAEDSVFMKRAHDMKIGGLPKLQQNLDVFRNGKIIWDPANLGPGVPDLSAYDTFQYRRLGSPGSIRLLHLKDMPDENPNFIELRVEEIDLSNSPAFIALSYVWGDHRPPLCQAFNRKRAEWNLPILCNGKKALVTYNLFCCLRRLTSSQDEPLRSLRKTPIFIDQLCINQSDKAEKASQVSMMGKIYSDAQAVVSWLGETDPDTNAAMSLVQALNDVPPSRITDPDFDPSALVNEFSHDDWLSLGALLSRPYFNRAWIVQEVVLARRLIVVCGDRLLDFDKIALALKLIADSRSLTELSQYVNFFRSEEDQMPVLGMRSPLLFGEQFSTLVAARESTRNINTSPINLLLLGRQFDAKYTVDKFFAMVGMAKHGMKTSESQALPAVDYDQRLRSVALRFAEFYLQISGSFSFLALVEDATHRTQENKDFPSWLPDPAAPLLPLPLRAEGFQLDGPTSWRPCGDVEAVDAPRIDGDLFRLRGYHFDGVAKTCVSFDVLDRSNEWSRFFNFISGLSNLQTNGFPVGEAPWRTLTASPDRPSGKVASTADLDEEFMDWCIALTKTIRNQYIRKLLHSATPGFKAAVHRINDMAFDYQTLGESLKSYFGGEDAIQEFLRMRNMTDAMKDRDMAESKNGGRRQRDVGQGLEKSLHDAWERHKDGVLPSPERVRRTLEAIHEARQGTPGYKEVFDSVARFEAAVEKKLHSRRLIVTREGRLGLGPESASEGHEIWAVAGASVPIILQKTGRGTFKYVGEAFVFGAMHGEAVSGAEQRLESVVLE